MTNRNLDAQLFMAFNLTTSVNTVTKTGVAVLTLAAALFVVIGIVRAWMGRLRPQVVINDISPVEGLRILTPAGVSPQLRQAVRQALQQESANASYAVLRTIEQDISSRLLRTHGSIRMRTIAAGLRSTTVDSLTTLAAGLRGVAPKQAEGLLAALSAALPAQRGWVVDAFPALRSAGSEVEIGLVLELSPLGHPPDAVSSFWASGQDLDPIPTGSTQEVTAASASLNLLLFPSAAWIATRLVSRQLAESNIPVRWRLLSGRKLRRELMGLQMQLAGQLSLYTMRKQQGFDREFARQALADLAESTRRLPKYFRPHSTEAMVHERLGWSYRRSGDRERAAAEFAEAVEAYGRALQALSESNETNTGHLKAAVQRERVRRAKCLLLCGDRIHLLVAQKEAAELIVQKELGELSNTTGSRAQDLYNGACLFAVAMGCADLPGCDRLEYALPAWQLLGRALLADGADGPWSRVQTDIELEAMNIKHRMLFTTELRIRHPDLTPIGGERARQVVEEALNAVGVNPVARTRCWGDRLRHLRGTTLS